MTHYCSLSGVASLPSGVDLVVSVDDAVTCASVAGVDLTLATVQSMVPPFSVGEGLLVSASVVAVWLFGHLFHQSTAVMKG